MSNLPLAQDSGFDPDPVVTGGDDSPIRGSKKVSNPRRNRLYPSSNPWWRPRSPLGRVLLGIGVSLVLGALSTVLIITRNFLMRDGRFRIAGASAIQTNGLTEVSRAEVLPIFGDDIGRNVLFVPLPERRKQLEAIPWIKQATVMRFLPDQISISVVERTPVAYVRQGQSIELADADGVILSMTPAMLAQHHYSFPVVTGINATDSPAARKARMALYLRFITELDQNHQHLTSEVSEIDLSDPEDLRATMPEQGSDILAHFGEDQFLHRLQIYHAHIADWRQRYPKLIGVDLRYSGEVPLEMATEIQTDTLSSIKSANVVPTNIKPTKIKPTKIKPTSIQPTVTQSQKATLASATPRVPNKINPFRAVPVKTKANPKRATAVQQQKASKARAKAVQLRAAQSKAALIRAAHYKQAPAHLKPLSSTASSNNQVKSHPLSKINEAVK